MGTKNKMRLDVRVLQLYPQLSRTVVQSLIMQGKVLIDGVPATKAGTPVSVDEQIMVNAEQPRYVSRAGFKLEGALNTFGIDVTDAICMDAGLSTGGFTDCLLQHGAAKVYGVDVGYGQVHEKIRADSRVIVMEKTNLRHLASLPELVDIVTLDLSFISVLKVLDAVKKVLKPHGTCIVLIKPQFEATKKDVGVGGIVTDRSVHDRVINTVKEGFVAQGFVCKGVIDSPITGTDGNKEFLAWFVYEPKEVA